MNNFNKMDKNQKESEEALFRRIRKMPVEEAKKEFRKLTASQKGRFFASGMVKKLNDPESHDKTI